MFMTRFVPPTNTCLHVSIDLASRIWVLSRPWGLLFIASAMICGLVVYRLYLVSHLYVRPVVLPSEGEFLKLNIPLTIVRFYLYNPYIG